MFSEDLSLLKADLDPQSYHLQFDSIASEVRWRAIKIRRLSSGLIPDDRSRLLQSTYFALDGGIVVPLAEFDRAAPSYFRRSRRALRLGRKVHLRGGRYTISANPTFELRTKLRTFKEDLHDGLQALEETRHILFQLAIADYIKNAAVTVLNSFLQDEKIGKYRYGNHRYQALRRAGLRYAEDAVTLFYAMLIHAKEPVRSSFTSLLANRRDFDKLLDVIIERYQEGLFSSRHITRPEATHPLVIAAAVAQFAHFGSRDVEVIVGLPSGATELSLAHTFGQKLINTNSCDLRLLPISFHSSKKEYDQKTTCNDNLSLWLSHHKEAIRGKKVVIVDDNSSTGTSLDEVRKIVSKCEPQTIEFAVAEADLCRSKLDLNNPVRPKVANRDLYVHSVNILPVSRSIKPKTDLREIFEHRKMEVCTKERYLANNPSFSRKMIGRVYLDLLGASTEEILYRLPPERIVRKFQLTPLSNFAPVNVSYQGERFNSVEHGYQAMKFRSGVWEQVTDRDIKLINRRLSPEDQIHSKDDIPSLFSGQRLSASGSKSVANYFRRRGFVRDDWDEIKVGIMTDLLIQKFADESFYSELQATGDKYLIEGNTWGDTFWGESGGRGRNFLGRILMQIRKHRIDELKRESDLIQDRLL
jgi:predicted NAD-dependent protein-ADP-ribosyltransferase YbiA (DUF1768 family)/hypoxanthine phosphoribosyltransferase